MTESEPQPERMTLEQRHAELEILHQDLADRIYALRQEKAKVEGELDYVKTELTRKKLGGLDYGS